MKNVAFSCILNNKYIEFEIKDNKEVTAKIKSEMELLSKFLDTMTSKGKLDVLNRLVFLIKLQDVLYHQKYLCLSELLDKDNEILYTYELEFLSNIKLKKTFDYDNVDMFNLFYGAARSSILNKHFDNMAYYYDKALGNKKYLDENNNLNIVFNENEYTFSYMKRQKTKK